MKSMLRAFVTAVSLCVSVLAWSQNPHTVNNETNNNTSGCSTPTATYVGATSCQVNFPGAKDDNTTAGGDSNNFPNNPTPNQVVDTVTFAAVPKNVADFVDDGVDIHNLVYPGYTGPVFVNMVLWHDGPGNNGNGFNYTPKQPVPPGENVLNGHYMTGYISDNSNQIAAQFAYMQRLKIDGIVANPPGPLPPAMTSQLTTNKNVNDAIEQFKTKAGGTASFLYTVMTDKVMWEQNQHSRCGGAGHNVTPDCVERVMICSLDYMNTPITSTFVCALDGVTYNGGGYFGDAHYWHVNSRPVLSYFLDASVYFGPGVCSASAPCTLYNDNQGGLTCTGSDDCWGKIWGNATQGIAHHIASFAAIPFIIHRNTSGPTGTGAPNNGTYRWFNPSQDQTYQNFGTLTGVDSLGYDGWLNQVFSAPPAVYLAVGYGKVDHAQSPFSNEIGDHKIIDARCGQTFLDSMARPANFRNPNPGFGTSHPLQAIEIATWDDYDEGSEMETGIDICINTLSASLNGSTLQWSISFNNAQFGSESKIDHYTIYYTSDGSTNTSIDHPLTALANVPVNNTGSYSFSLPNTLPNPTIVYVKAVAKPMLQNRLTAGIVFTPVPPAPGRGSITITGFEQSDEFGNCDSGVLYAFINGVESETPYSSGGGACDDVLPGFYAQYLANAINGNNPYVTAQWNGDYNTAVINLTARSSGAGTNYSLSSGSYSNSFPMFSPPSYSATASGSTLTGGHN